MLKDNRMNPNKQRAKYIAADICSAIIVWLLFLVFRWIINDGKTFSYGTVLVPAFNFYTPLFVYPLACLLVHYLSGYYVSPYKKSLLHDFFTTFMASAIISFGAFFFIIIDDVVINYQRYYVSLVTLFGMQLSVSYVFRLIITMRTRRLIHNGFIQMNTVIIGIGKNAQRIAEELHKNIYENRVVGFISPTKDVTEKTSVQILGSLDDFAELKQKYAIVSVVVALDDKTSETDLFKIINELYSYGVEIQFTPRIYEILTGVARIQKLNIGPLVNITEHSMAAWELSVKRAVDVVVSFFALILFSPFMFLCAIRIKQDSVGPVFYKQQRIGRHGTPFNIVKFRTMYVDSENGHPRLSTANDDRVTKIGHWLRKYRIDEIPQFWNVLIGEMSLVGPRPEREYYIKQIVERAPYYCLIYKIRPGLTSWGPIKIGYADTIDKMVERLNYDIIYVDNMSLLVDIKILWYTIEVIIKGKGQ